MNNSTLEQLTREHGSAKKKLTLGIVFTAIAFALVFIGAFSLSLSGAFALYIVCVILSLPFYGVGVPFLIIGIIKTIKANRAIALARAEEMRHPNPSASQSTQAAQPAPAAQTYSQPQAAPQPEAPRQQFESAAPQPEAPQQQSEPAASQPEPNESATGFVDIDWQKYNPLEAGVSYNTDKNYKFHRAEGFVGSVPQTFVNRTFPKCPICCSKDPYWTITQHNQMSWKGNLYLFKCSKCEGIISMSMPDVTTLGNGGSGIVSNPSVGLVNLAAKASSGKEAGAVYAVIESVGNSGVTPECQGKEFKLEQLQEMFDRM